MSNHRSTARAPAPYNGTSQVDPGQRDVRIYTLRDPGGLIAQVLVPRYRGTANAITYEPDIEYWMSMSTSSPSGNSLLVTWVDYGWDRRLVPGAVEFRMARNPTWSSANALQVPPNSGSTFVNTTLNIGLTWELRRTTSGWTGSLTWFNSDGHNQIFAGPCPQGGVTLAAKMDVAATKIPWYSATVAPW